MAGKYVIEKGRKRYTSFSYLILSKSAR